MSRRTVEPVSPVDAFNPPADGPVILHDDATAAAYKAATEDARQRHRSGLPPASARGQQAVQAPAEAPLPLLGVARAVAGREIGRLKAEVAAIERDLQRGIVGPGGNVSEHLVTRQREARAYLEQVRAEVERIDSMDDEQVRRFAFGLGAR
jgi:hypothetical protein